MMAALPSCEKFNPDDPETADTPNNNGTITKDGVIQKTGLVDLGLSVKWAACDLGEDGFVEDCTIVGKNRYWSTVAIATPPAEIGGTSFDWATSILGDQWQTPSKAQWEELKKKCRISYGVYENTVGWTVTGLSGNAIFIPLGISSSIMSYWTSSFDKSRYWCFDFSDSGLEADSWGSSNLWKYIRPVEKK